MMASFLKWYHLTAPKQSYCTRVAQRIDTVCNGQFPPGRDKLGGTGCSFTSTGVDAFPAIVSGFINLGVALIHSSQVWNGPEGEKIHRSTHAPPAPW
jgi:hypothetical protein